MRKTSLWGWAAGAVWALASGSAVGQAPVERVGGRIDLPTSKQITGVVPGSPQPLDSLPVSLAVSPDGRWVVSVNGGYGTYESGYMQSLAVMDTRTGKLVDYPDARTGPEAKQTLFSGLAFSPDGRRLFASMASVSDPEGKKAGDTGSGIAVYSISAEGKLLPERLLKMALEPLAEGRRTKLVGGVDGRLGVPYPAAIAVVETHVSDARHGAPNAAPVRGSRSGRLLVADNESDDVLLMDALTGTVVWRFDLSESDAVPATFPVALAVAKDGRRAFAALWNASEVVELDLVKGTVGRKLALLKQADPVRPGSHPDALAMAPDGQTLYVALGNRDAVAAVDLRGEGLRLKGLFDVRLPGQTFYGAQPESLAVSADGSRLYCANMGSDAVAVLPTRKLTRSVAEKGMVEPVGFIPTEWLPMGVAVAGGKLYVASGKGTGTGPNNFAQKATAATQDSPRMRRSFTYIANLLHGSLAAIDEGMIAGDLARLTAETLEDNRMKAAEETIPWDAGVLARMRGGDASSALRDERQAGEGKPTRGVDPTHRDEAAMNGARTHRDPAAMKEDPTHRGEDAINGARAAPATFPGPIRHVIYIIKENRTYDQLFGDLEFKGNAVGNGDKSLTMYGAEVTPNQHRLALQFGVLDNFYDSGEVSGDGHVWSNTAIGTDYLERTWQLNYRGREHPYDFEGVVAQGLPLEQKIPDVNEPASGYLWGNLARHGLTLYHFGEFISSKFCTESGSGGRQDDPREGPMLEGRACSTRSEVKPGERLPEIWGGGVNEWPWAIPLLASNTATKPELVGHFAAESPDFNLRVPDQVRVGIFLKHLDGWITDRKAGKDTMPNFVMLRLPNDHTGGTTPGGPTPKASVADNDLAIGRAVEAISHSAFWEDTAFFILEDDAQNGADHVDAHRSDGLVVSKYSPRGAEGAPFVDSRFYSTVSMIRTMETVLGLPPMNNNDAFSSMMGSLFTGAGDQPAFDADVRNRENGLIFTANPKTAPGARASAKMDFRHADRADARKLNVILWQDAMGAKAVPAMLLEKRKKAKNDGDD